MIIVKLRYIFTLVILIAVIHTMAVFFRLYEKNVGIDIPQHILAGITLGLIWLYVLQENESAKIKMSGDLLLGISIVCAALFGGILWELGELSLLKFLPDYAYMLKLYSLTLAEAASDVLAGAIGGIIVAALVLCKIKSKYTHHPPLPKKDLYAFY